ncbi:MAG: right-handed parallel beta-helix repeat-containing protein [Candidatus Zixiibacteriota bacterium]|nr:MAG: right-handed parallel beta-helix repeat-containing protein [candidate division Zixibacteria bacterium]
MRNTVITLLCILSLGMLRAEARSFYVALNGSNSSSGSITAPWRTIAYATSSSSGVTAGDTIHVRAGNYPESVYPAVSGTLNNPIVVKNYLNESVNMNPGRFRFDSGINNWVIKGFSIMYSSSSGITVTGTHTGRIFVMNCTVSKHKENGFYLGNGFGGVGVYDCDVQYNGEWGGVQQSTEGTGIVMYGNSGTLWARRNLIANNWAKGVSHASAGTFNGDSTVFDSNLVINNFESGLDFRAGDSYIRYNYFSRNGVRDPEPGEWGDKGLSCAGNSGNLIAYNVVKSSGSWELDPRGSYSKYYNNTFIKDNYYNVVPGSPYSATIIFWDGNPPGNEFKNNIIMNLCSQPYHSQVVLAELWGRYDEQLWRNNLYWSPNSTAPSPYNRPFRLQGHSAGTYQTLAQVQANFPDQEIGSINAAPNFVSYADSNFHLAWGSPAIDAGTYVGFPYNGNAPDCGRFEYSSGNRPPWITPVLLDYIMDEDSYLGEVIEPFDPNRPAGSGWIWELEGLDLSGAGAPGAEVEGPMTLSLLPTQANEELLALVFPQEWSSANLAQARLSLHPADPQAAGPTVLITEP